MGFIKVGENKRYFYVSAFLVLSIFIWAAPAIGAPSTKVDGEWVLPTGNGAREDIRRSMGSDNVMLPEDYPDEEEIVIEVSDEETDKLILEARIAQEWLAIKEDLALRQYDKGALEVSDEFKAAKHAPPAAPGHGGAVVITYGSVQPKIICRPLRVTDLQFGAGEKITSVHVGDSVRWSVSPAMSGSGANATTHAIIKPLMPNISTNLIVHTDHGRVYHIELIAQEINYMPYVAYAYPDDDRRKWEDFLSRQRQEKNETIELAADPTALNFNYKIDGSKAKSWHPVAVFDDTTKTYIKMPDTLRSSEAPLFAIVKNKKKQIVNYNVISNKTGTYYVIDRLFDKAHLFIGQGGIEERIVIVRIPPKKTASNR